MSHSPHPSPTTPLGPDSLPLVVQVGFAGSRELCLTITQEKFLAKKLSDRLGKLRADLGLTERHFFCGISQIAIGADTVFTEACSLLGNKGWTQRIFLPQHRDTYLQATGSSGPDFSADQQQNALRLLKLPHVIQEGLVSDSPERRSRFHDTNVEIARVSDVLVCLLAEVSPAPEDGAPANEAPAVAGRTQAVNEPKGGTQEIIALADNRACPVLILQLKMEDGEPVLTEKWKHKEKFKAPELPRELAGARLTEEAIPPAAASYAAALKNLTSRVAAGKARLFRLGAFLIIGAHLVATVCAVFALKGAGAPWLPLVLLLEVLLLLFSFAVHQILHKKQAVEVWALARLTAEVTRSQKALGEFHLYPEYLFKLPFPDALRPVLRTLSVLHLRSSRSAGRTEWEAMRKKYISERLHDLSGGQIPYYTRTRNQAAPWLKLAQIVFFTCSGLAIISTLLKLLLKCMPSSGCFYDWVHPCESVLGPLAIILPVLAVGALSLAAALDLNARERTSSEMLSFLERQENRLRNAASASEYSRLLLETETRLLGEIVTWYARRSFAGIA